MTTVRTGRNAQRHCRPPATVRIWATPARIVVTVHDTDPSSLKAMCPRYEGKPTDHTQRLRLVRGQSARSADLGGNLDRQSDCRYRARTAVRLAAGG